MNEKFVHRLTAEIDQDLAACDAWMDQASPADILTVWSEIQIPHKDPVKELVTRFAQLAVSQAFQRLMERRKK